MRIGGFARRRQAKLASIENQEYNKFSGSIPVADNINGEIMSPKRLQPVRLIQENNVLSHQVQVQVRESRKSGGYASNIRNQRQPLNTLNKSTDMKIQLNSRSSVASQIQNVKNSSTLTSQVHEVGIGVQTSSITLDLATRKRMSAHA